MKTKKHLNAVEREITKKINENNIRDDEIIFRKIAKYPHYSISNIGTVRCDLTDDLLHQQMNQNGYYYITLNDNDGEHNISVHRLVALSFVLNLENKLEIKHIDGDKRNNKMNNLKWINKD